MVLEGILGTRRTVARMGEYNRISAYVIQCMDSVTTMYGVVCAHAVRVAVDSDDMGVYVA